MLASEDLLCLIKVFLGFISVESIVTISQYKKSSSYLYPVEGESTGFLVFKRTTQYKLLSPQSFLA